MVSNLRPGNLDSVPLLASEELADGWGFQVQGRQEYGMKKNAEKYSSACRLLFSQFSKIQRWYIKILACFTSSNLTVGSFITKHRLYFYHFKTYYKTALKQFDKKVESTTYSQIKMSQWWKIRPFYCYLCFCHLVYWFLALIKHPVWPEPSKSLKSCHYFVRLCWLTACF